MLVTLLPVLINLLLAALSSFGVDVPASISALVTQLGPVVEKIAVDIQGGGTPSAETVTILQDLLPAIQDVKADTTLDPKYVEWASLLDEMVVNVTIADQTAQQGINSSTLHAE
jgi:hypothetical protein